MIISVVALKGGTGKSTTTMNLAEEFSRIFDEVRVLDTDPQNTAFEWFATSQDTNEALREEYADMLEDDADAEIPGYEDWKYTVQGFQLAEIKRLKDDPNVVTIIDTPGGDPNIAAEVIKKSDYVVFPLRPTYIEINRLLETIDNLDMSRRKALHRVLFTRVKTSASASLESAKEQMADEGIPFFPSYIPEREAIARQFGSTIDKTFGHKFIVQQILDDLGIEIDEE